MDKLKPKIAVVSASLGSIDQIPKHAPQSINCDFFLYTDENFPPRMKAMTPRLQAKIPKCFAWQMAPGYDYYLWLDGTFALPHPDSVKYFYDLCQGYDIVLLKHNRRPDVRQEARYTRKGLKQQGKNAGSKYIIARYESELVAEQMAEITADKDFVDDFLVQGGVFMYRNTPAVQQMLKEWWYHISRYLIMDQCSFPYVLKKSGIKMNIRPDYYDAMPYLEHRGHNTNSK